MPHVSKNQLNKKVEKELLELLEIVLTKTGNREKMNNFLLSLLSRTERLMLAKRLGTVLMLRSGASETEIAGTLHITRETVSRLSLLLQLKGSGYDVATAALEKEKIFQSFKKAAVSLARYSIRAASGYVKPTVFD